MVQRLADEGNTRKPTGTQPRREGMATRRGCTLPRHAHISAARVDDDPVAERACEAMVATHEQRVIAGSKLRVEPLRVARLRVRSPAPAEGREAPIEFALAAALVQLQDRRGHVALTQRRQLWLQWATTLEARVHAQQTLDAAVGLPRHLYIVHPRQAL